VTESEMELTCCDAVRYERARLSAGIAAGPDSRAMARAALRVLALIRRCERRGQAHEVLARHDVGNSWRLK